MLERACVKIGFLSFHCVSGLKKDLLLLVLLLELLLLRHGLNTREMMCQSVRRSNKDLEECSVLCRVQNFELSLQLTFRRLQVFS